MFTFILVLIVGVAASGARSCPPGMSLDSATCIECTDPNCGDCADDKDICLGACPIGFYLSGEKCARLDGEPVDSKTTMRCLEGKAGPDKPICTKCAPKFGLMRGECNDCEHLKVRRGYNLL